MSREIGSFAPQLSAWTRGFDAFSADFQVMTAKIRELDQQLQETSAELINETEARKNWMNRANAAESRQASSLGTVHSPS
jgi:hypothetical protein